MTDLTILTSVFVPLVIATIPAVVLYRKNRALLKLNEQKAVGDNFNSILVATKTIRDELSQDKAELRQLNKELEAEIQDQKSVQGDLAKIIVNHTNRIADISIQNTALFKHLKIILGMKTISDIKQTKIFVLEDNLDDAKLMKRLFEANNIKNVTFFTDHDAFYNSVDADVRILIVDYKLSGGITGIDVIKKVIAINDYRYFIMLSGMEDFDVIYTFNRLITHGVYVLKGKLETNDLLVRSIKNTMYYLQLLSDTYNEIGDLR